MWTKDDIEIDYEVWEHTELIVYIKTPAGLIELQGCVSLTDLVLHLDGAIIQGLKRGAIGRSGLNAIGRKLLEVADVEQIVIQGGRRTSGRCIGRIPRQIRFPKL